MSWVSSPHEVRLQTLPHTMRFSFFLVLLPFTTGRDLQAWAETRQGLQSGANSGSGSGCTSKVEVVWAGLSHLGTPLRTNNIKIAWLSLPVSVDLNKKQE